LAELPRILESICALRYYIGFEK